MTQAHITVKIYATETDKISLIDLGKAVLAVVYAKHPSYRTIMKNICKTKVKSSKWMWMKILATPASFGIMQHPTLL